MQLEHWLIRDADHGASLPASDEAWCAATAPGDTCVALHRAGRLPDPLRDDNEAACAWVEGRTWWWRTTFSAPAAAAHERITLVFEGLDTHATIWFDGELLGSSDNMFVAARFDVTSRVRTGSTHTLAVRFVPNDVVMAEREAPFWPLGSSPVAVTKRNLVRKAQFGWGWDFAPRLVTVGLWKPVRLERHRHGALDDVALRTLRLDAESAQVQVDVGVDAFDVDAALTAEIRLADPDGHVVAQATCDLGAHPARVCLDVERPRPWWTADLGGQPLYTLTVTLRHGDEAVDARTLRVGLRTIAIDTSPDPDEPGATLFRFVLNGVPLFARGANWVPASVFVGALAERDIPDLLERALAGNMNMIRVWGGGIYESDEFFDACDRLGLLVWQDFMFACAPYPDDDPRFMASVRTEIAQQVRRLRHHPSLAVWCGNNECQIIQQIHDHLTGAEGTTMPGSDLFERVMPELVATLDPTTPYRPSSPFGGANANSMRHGDEHNWTVWHGIPPVPDDRMVGVIDRSPEAIAYTRYAEDATRFASEFGILAAPALATLERWVAPGTLALGNAAFLNRIKDKPPDKVLGMLVSTTGLPETLQQYVDFTQFTQAEGLKFGIEHFRRRMPHCSGTLIWQFNDCWPGISWSLVDHDRTCKAAYFAVKRAYAPLATSFRMLDDGSVELWATNAGTTRAPLSAVVELMTLAGTSVWRDGVEAEVAPCTSRVLWRAEAARLAAAPDRVLTLRSPQVAADRLFFAPFKDLPLEPAALRLSAEPVDERTTRVTIASATYACFVHLLAPHPATIFSDNHFDLRAGESRTLLLTGPEQAPDPATLQLRSLARIAAR
jgi:beta-mannosidase